MIYFLFSHRNKGTLFHIFRILSANLQQKLDQEVENLHRTDEREASEESHRSSYSGQLVYKLGCSVLSSKIIKDYFFISNLLVQLYLLNSVKG